MEVGVVNRIVCVNVCECRSELCVCVVNLGGEEECCNMYFLCQSVLNE